MNETSEIGASTRRWYRFPFRLKFWLRTLLLGVLIFGSAVGWLASLVKRAHEQRRVVQRVESLGGKVSYDYTLNWDRTDGKPSPPGNRFIRAIVGDDVYARVAAVHFMSPVSDVELQVVKELPDLTGIGIYDGTISSKGLENFQALGKLNSLNLTRTTVTTTDLSSSPIGSRLEQLSLGGAPVVDGTLLALPKLINLEGLQLIDASVTDNGLSSVGSCSGLRSLDLFRCTAITDKGIGQLKSLKNLRHLRIAGVPITEASLVLLDELPQLEELQLRGLPLADEAMRHLQGLKSMRHLGLRGCQVTDSGIAYLKDMHDLESLDIAESQITDTALATLARFPRLKTLCLWTKNTTDAGAASHLRKLKGLKFLEVGPGITRAGALELSKALPECQVLHIDGNNGVEYLPLGGQ
jgi:Leucine-rich repeat (LRR) protein